MKKKHWLIIAAILAVLAMILCLVTFKSCNAKDDVSSVVGSSSENETVTEVSSEEVLSSEEEVSSVEISSVEIISSVVVNSKVTTSSKTSTTTTTSSKAPTTSSSKPTVSSKPPAVSSTPPIQSGYPKTPEEFLAAVKPYGTSRGYTVTLENDKQIEMGGRMWDGCFAVFSNSRYVIKVFCFKNFLGTDNWTTGQIFFYDAKGDLLKDKDVGNSVFIGEEGLGRVLNDYR